MLSSDRGREQARVAGSCEWFRHKPARSRNELVKDGNVLESVPGKGFVSQPFVFAFAVAVPGRVAVSPLAAGEPGVASKPASPVAGPTQVWCCTPQWAPRPTHSFGRCFQKLLVTGAGCDL